MNMSAGSLAYGYQGAAGDRPSGIAGCGGFGRRPSGRANRPIGDSVPSPGEWR